MTRRIRKVASAPASTANRTEEILRGLMREGKWVEAVRMASRFPVLGDEKGAIQKAWEAYERPAFQRQIGRDPEALIAAGKEALVRRYGKPGEKYETAPPGATFPPAAWQQGPRGPSAA